MNRQRAGNRIRTALRRACGRLLLLHSVCLPLASLAQTACPQASGISAEGLIGLWEVTLAPPPAPTGQLRLQAHPEHTGSLKGVLVQGRHKVEVVADWDDGELSLEESHDGQRIDATWQGTASPGQCGRQIEGTRVPSGAGSALPTRFTMHRVRERPP